MRKSHIEALRAARSMNDVLSVVQKIKQSVSHSGNSVMRSTSAGITIDYNDTSRRTSGGDIPKTAAKIKVSPTASKSMKEAYDKLSELQENIHELDSAVSLIENNFKTSTKRKSALDAIKALRNDIDAQIEKHLDALSKFGEGNCPDALKKMGDVIEKHLRKVLPKQSYSDIVRDLFVAPGETADSYNFCVYICVDDLKNEQGFVHHRYYFVLTGLYKAGQIAYFLNAVPTFRSPGKFPVGKAISTETDAIRRVDMLLDAHNFETEFDKKPVAVDKHTLQKTGVTAIKGVEDIDVEDDSIVVTMKTLMSEALVNKAVESIMPRLRGILGVTGAGTVLKYKSGKRKNKTVIFFIKVSNGDNKPQAKHFQLNAQKVRELADVFNLNEHQVEALKFALHS